MTCRELVDLVTNYFEDRMAVPERRRFEEHVASCGPCRAYLDQMRDTVRLTGELREDSIDPSSRDTLLDVFRDWKES